MEGIVAPTDSRWRQDLRQWENGYEEEADEEKVKIDPKPQNPIILVIMNVNFAPSNSPTRKGETESMVFDSSEQVPTEAQEMLHHNKFSNMPFKKSTDIN